MAVQRTEQVRRYRRQRPSVGAARMDARALADKWQRPEIADDLALLVSEVVTNAVIHGTTGRGSQVHVHYRLLDDRLRVEVRDHGRGLIVVASLAHRWDVIPRVIGKSVWFEILLNKQAAPDIEEAATHGA